MSGNAQPGSLDKNFNHFSWIITDFGYWDKINSITQQADGKILAVGSSIVDIYDLTRGSKISVARYEIDGTLDSSFGKNGKLFLNFNNQVEFGTQILVKPDGQIIIGGTEINYQDGGSYDFIMIRLSEDGSIDSSFGKDGRAVKFFRSLYVNAGYFLTLQHDGKILVGGTTYQDVTGYDFIVARYNTDGSPDLSFKSKGYVTMDFDVNQADALSCIAIQDDGKIIVAGNTSGGTFSYVIARLNADGSVDKTFASGPGEPGYGFTSKTILGIHILSSGKIVALGWKGGYVSSRAYELLRYNSNGTPDSSFGSGGLIYNYVAGVKDTLRSLLVSSDDKIILAGFSSFRGTADFILRQFTADGKPDSTFGTNGSSFSDYAVSYDQANAAFLQADGKILLGGSTLGTSNNNFALIRYDPSGKIDVSFGNPAKITTTTSPANDEANTVTVSSDDHIFLGGHTEILSNDLDLVLITYDKDGNIYPKISAQGKLSFTDNMRYIQLNAVIVHSDSDMLYAGHFYDPVKTDVEFVLQHYSTATGFGIITTFTTDFGGGANYCQSLLELSDGKLLASGYVFTGRNYDFALCRYEKDGSLDSSFGINSKVTTDISVNQDYAYSSALQKDGKIILAGTSLNDKQWQIALVRYNSDGSLDNSFGNSGIVLTTLHDSDDEAHGIALQNDGKIVVAGYTFNGKNYDVALARYNINGDLDSTFGNFGKVETGLAAGDIKANGMVIEPDGKIIVAGYAFNGKDDDFAVLCYNSNGSLDKNFGKGGITITDFGFGDDHGNAVAFQSDGAIVVAGYAYNGTDKDYAVARYLPDLNLGVIDHPSSNQAAAIIYPNPVHSAARVAYELSKPESVTMKLYDVTGKEVAIFLNHQIREAGKNSEQIVMPNNLPVGSYYLSVETEQGKMSVKIMKSEP